MVRYKLTHNGYKSVWFDTVDKMEAYIASILNEQKHLSPKEIFRGYADGNKAENEPRGGHIIKSVIVWQYATLYTEVFMIEECLW